MFLCDFGTDETTHSGISICLNFSNQGLQHDPAVSFFQADDWVIEILFENSNLPLRLTQFIEQPISLKTPFLGVCVVFDVVVVDAGGAFEEGCSWAGRGAGEFAHAWG